ncbi:hypothetical protein NDU88_008152 [Pleurodeles waltl]|uniref:Uncharacterized protein n=1 Tax=Pleurodeles waltl TaxID=8319 RepID=A0AAV7VU87_PLEWA|nr:hypothetical protein NDU88_008152 [Pleurodeles waltl]
MTQELGKALKAWEEASELQAQAQWAEKEDFASNPFEIEEDNNNVGRRTRARDGSVSESERSFTSAERPQDLDAQLKLLELEERRVEIQEKKVGT